MVWSRTEERRRSTARDDADGAVQRASWARAVTRWGIVASALLVQLGGCNVDPTGTPPSLVPHCADLEGNLTCLSDYPSRPYCNRCVPASQNQGCVTQPPPLSCSPDGSTSPITGDEDPTTAGSSESTGGSESSTTTMVADTSSDGSTTVAPFECRERGQLDEDCEALDPGAPYCMESACVTCTDAGGDDFCVGLDLATPACDVDGGRCQSCTDADPGFCGGATPVCGGDGACQACTSHDDCETACHISPADPLHGECFASDQVLWVDRSEPCPGLGTQDSPACSLADAVAMVPPGESWTLFVAGGANYAEQVVIDDVTVAIRGSSNVQITGDAGLDSASVVVTGATVYFDTVRIRANVQSHGLSCGGGVVWFDDSQIRNNLEYGIFNTAPCDTTLRRSAVLRNEGGGVRQFGGSLALDNSVVVSNGDGMSGPGINLQFADLRALYSTIVGNDGAGPDSVQCLEATGAIRNSIVSGVATNSIELDCFVFEFTTNAIDTASFVEAGSATVGAYQAAWFNNPSEGDMRLDDPLTSGFGNLALWTEGDPPLDADGTARPVGGLLGYVGVDEP